MESPLKKERYFFAAYVCTVDGDNVTGSISFACDQFPPKKEIIRWIEGDVGGEDVVITSISEFDNEADFDNWSSK